MTTNVPGWKLVCDANVDDLMKISKYVSERSGLRLAHVEGQPGPLVFGYLCVVTEAHDDDGLPHTLEHLVFMGSHDYSYKGFLDKLAHRCLSNGTNAWTDTDHTCYTLTTVGSSGFVTLVPVFLDHVLFPTLKKSHYITEVHHVNGEGEDAGVVYCEMQSVENTAENRANYALLRALYPGRCGYKSETGGVMKNLRESTSHEKIIKYHHEFYRPENLCLIAVGNIEAAEIFAALEPLEKKLSELARDREAFQRPWSDPVPPFVSSEVIEVAFPCDDEDSGLVCVGWRGPSAVENLSKLLATVVLLEYLTESSISPLQTIFVESTAPLASNVSYNVIENRDCAVYMSFENVPSDKIGEVGPLFINTLKNMASSSSGIDMERMKTVLKRRIRHHYSELENNPEAAGEMVIGDILYGNTKDDFLHRVDSISCYKRLQEEAGSFWLSLLCEISSKPMVTVNAVPSLKLHEEMAEEEKARISEQTTRLGKDGLAAKAAELEQAMDENDEPPPVEMLQAFKPPGIDSIKYYALSNWEANRGDCNFKLVNISSHFAYFLGVMDCSTLPTARRLYLPLLLELITELPLELEDGSVVPHEAAIGKRLKETVHVGGSVGVAGQRLSAGSFSELAVLFVQVERQDYAVGARWIHDLLARTKFTSERVQVVATKLENSISEMKRDGQSVGRDMLTAMTFTSDSNMYAITMMQQKQFLSKLTKDVESGQSQHIIQALEELRKHLAQSIWLFVATDFKKIEDPLGPILRFSNSENFRAVKDSCKVSATCPKRHCVVGLGTLETSYVFRNVEGIADLEHPDLPALMVFLQYICQTEGPMWNEVRGPGLAYGYNIYPSVTEGLLHLELTEAAHPMKAFKATKALLESACGASFEWSDTELESAKSSLVFEIVNREGTMASAITQTLIHHLHGLDHDSFRNGFLTRVMEIEKTDLRNVGQKFVKRLLDDSICRTVITCHPSKAGKITNALTSLGMESDNMCFGDSPEFQ